jgi:hypothetical protein
MKKIRIDKVQLVLQGIPETDARDCLKTLPAALAGQLVDVWRRSARSSNSRAVERVEPPRIQLAAPPQARALTELVANQVARALSSQIPKT